MQALVLALWRLTCLAGLSSGALASTAFACAVCIAVPEDTAADRLLAAEAIVLARENPDKPFTYRVVEVLAGDVEAQEIDLFLNSSLRRQLAHQPDRSVVLVRESMAPTRPRTVAARLLNQDAPEREWRSLGLATARYEAMIREILDQAPEWGAEEAKADFDPLSIGAATPSDRVRFFMPYLSDPDERSRLLAYLEVGRAPYDQIRVADDYVAPEAVRAFLADFTYVEWHPLYILLFGMNATADEQAEVRALMNSRQRFSSTLNLGAWTAAFIEIDGVTAIDWLDAQYLSRPGRPVTAIEEVLTAMSVHGTNGRTELRSRIAESYALALENHPNASARAAVDLTVWKDRRFTNIAQDILSRENDLNPATEFALGTYAALHGG